MDISVHLCTQTCRTTSELDILVKKYLAPHMSTKLTNTRLVLPGSPPTWSQYFGEKLRDRLTFSSLEATALEGWGLEKVEIYFFFTFSCGLGPLQVLI